MTPAETELARALSVEARRALSSVEGYGWWHRKNLLDAWLHPEFLHSTAWNAPGENIHWESFVWVPCDPTAILEACHARVMAQNVWLMATIQYDGRGSWKCQVRVVGDWNEGIVALGSTALEAALRLASRVWP